jgi:hypothetical protein
MCAKNCPPAWPDGQPGRFPFRITPWRFTRLCRELGVAASRTVAIMPIDPGDRRPRKIMNEWNIQSRAHACQACGRNYSDQQPYHTLLFDLKHEIQRRDVCEPCWRAEHTEDASDCKGFISHWQGIYEAPPAAAPDAIQKENAETLLRKIIESNEPKYAAASYILAVMLERKRILKVKEQFKRDGRRIFVYEQPRTGDIFTIVDPDLQLNQLEEVQRSVATLLEQGLIGQPATSAEQPSSESVAIPVATSVEESTEPSVESEPESVKL